MQKSTSTLFVEAEDSICVPLGRDADSHDGLNPQGAIVDELHAHPHRDQWDVLRSGMGARREPLMLGITTAGSKREGLCWDLDHLGQQIPAGVIDDKSTFTFIARLDEGDDAYDEANWHKANPNRGVSVSIEDIRDEARGAINTPAARTAFLRKRANVWTSSAKAWLALEQWKSCECRSISGCEPGLVTATLGEIIDHEYPATQIQELSRAHSLREVVFDPAMALQLMPSLQADG